ncbi:alpha/beta fold hydrolase [Chloroflexota bacterium]
MIKKTVIRVIIPTAIALSCLLAFSSPALSAPEDSGPVTELNLVFLHGAGGNTCSFQMLEDYILAEAPRYISEYRRTNPSSNIKINVLKRCYPGYMDIDTWSRNIVTSINEHFEGKDNLILIGHSMGGKTALYTVANDIGGIAERVAMVVTINSPVKGLNRYFVTGGGSVYNYLQALWQTLDGGISYSVAFHDSSEEGARVAASMPWIAFISSEPAPLSHEYDVPGADPWPRNMDDGLVPLSAQYAEDANVIYYGNFGHSDFAKLEVPAEFIGERILRSIFGDYIEFSTFARGGTYTHTADWLLGTDRWQDVVGGLPMGSGTVVHKNESYFKWQEWEDVVGECPAWINRDKFYISRISTPGLSSIEEASWVNTDNVQDCRLYLKTRAAPRSTVEVNWSIFEKGLQLPTRERSYFEIKIVSGTPLTGIKTLSWETVDPLDLRVRVWSEAQSPFRWFKGEWRIYSRESRWVQLINQFSETVP